MKKVQFTLPVYDHNGQVIYDEIPPEPGNIDPTLKLTKMRVKVHYGFILHWGTETIITEDKTPLTYTVCYVEDQLSGKIFAVQPHELRVIKNNKK